MEQSVLADFVQAAHDDVQRLGIVLPDQLDELAKRPTVLPYLRDDRILRDRRGIRGGRKQVQILEIAHDQRVPLQPPRLVEIRREQAVLALGDRLLEADTLLLEVAGIGLLVQAGIDDDHVGLELKVALRPGHFPCPIDQTMAPALRTWDFGPAYLRSSSCSRIGQAWSVSRL